MCGLVVKAWPYPILQVKPLWLRLNIVTMTVIVTVHVTVTAAVIFFTFIFFTYFFTLKSSQKILLEFEKLQNRLLLYKNVIATKMLNQVIVEFLIRIFYFSDFLKKFKNLFFKNSKNLFKISFH